jgi:hypothetical protein
MISTTAHRRFFLIRPATGSSDWRVPRLAAAHLADSGRTAIATPSVVAPVIAAVPEKQDWRAALQKAVSSRNCRTTFIKSLNRLEAFE